MAWILWNWPRSLFWNCFELDMASWNLAAHRFEQEVSPEMLFVRWAQPARCAWDVLSVPLAENHGAFVLDVQEAKLVFRIVANVPSYGSDKILSDLTTWLLWWNPPVFVVGGRCNLTWSTLRHSGPRCLRYQRKCLQMLLGYLRMPEVNLNSSWW